MSRRDQECFALIVLFDGFAIQPVNHVSKPTGRAADGFKAVTRNITRLIHNETFNELLSDGAME